MAGTKKPESVAEILKRRKANAKTTKPEPEKSTTVEKVVIISEEPKPTFTNLKKTQFLQKNIEGIERLKNPATYFKFVEFLVAPMGTDGLKTQVDFAKEFKVSEQCLSEWKKRPGFWEEVREYRREFFKSDILKLATATLKRRLLTDAGAPEIKLAFQLADEFEEKSSVEVKKTTLTTVQMTGIDSRLKQWKENK